MHPRGEGIVKLIVVVTFNALALVRAQAETLRDWLLADDEARIVILDNSGSGETIDIVLEVTTPVADRVIAAVNTRNPGFSPTVNDAVTRAEKRWGPMDAVGLLNPDVSTDAATIDAVFARLDDPRVGISAPLLVDVEGVPDRGSLRRYWNGRRLFAEVLGRPGVASALGSLPRSIPPTTGRVDVDITSGAFMAIRRSVFGSGLDTRLPMYLEDQEICHRARRAELAVQVDASLVAEHLGGHSRRSHTAITRQLRLMELATAPALSWKDVARTNGVQARVVVGSAATLRTMIAGAVYAASVGAPDRRAWASSQARLGSWLVAWAFDPRALDPIEWAAS